VKHDCACCQEWTAGSANNCGDGGEEHSRKTTGTADTEERSTATPGTEDHSRATPGTEDDDKLIQVQRTTVK
jgi:hypothetical protein